MVFRKTSSSVFISTNIDYVLRNLGVRSLIVAGVMTDQCVESAVRDACDLGYLVTLIPDACTTNSAERHQQSLLGIRGYCRQRCTNDLLAEIAGTVHLTRYHQVICREIRRGEDRYPQSSRGAPNRMGYSSKRMRAALPAN